MLTHCGYIGVTTVTGDLPMRYPSPAAWWDSGWTRARRISWQHIPTAARPAAQAEVLGLLEKLRAPDGSITRTPRYGWTISHRPPEPDLDASSARRCIRARTARRRAGGKDARSVPATGCRPAASIGPPVPQPVQRRCPRDLRGQRRPLSRGLHLCPDDEDTIFVIEIDVAHFNYEHGGLIGGHDHALVPAVAMTSRAWCGWRGIGAAGRTS